MMTLIAAAAVAAAQPVTPANPPASQVMQMGETQHAAKAEECCCEDMAAKHDGQGSGHAGHTGR